MDQRLSLITLGVADVAASRRFYVDGLGWRPSSAGNEEVVFFQLGGIALALFDRAALAKDMGLAEPGPAGFRGITLAYNTRSKDKVDAVLAQAAKAGATILKPAQQTSWGGYAGYFADPDGHPWEVAWNPFWQIDEDGAVVLPA